MKTIEGIKKDIENAFSEITKADEYAFINSDKVNGLNDEIFELTKNSTTISDFEKIKDDLNNLIDNLDYYTDYDNYDGDLTEYIEFIENIIDSIEDEDTKTVIQLEYTPYIKYANTFNDALKNSYDKYNKYALSIKENLSILFRGFIKPENFNKHYVEECFSEYDKIKLLEDYNNIYLDEYKLILKINYDLFFSEEEKEHFDNFHKI